MANQISDFFAAEILFVYRIIKLSRRSDGAKLNDDLLYRLWREKEILLKEYHESGMEWIEEEKRVPGLDVKTKDDHLKDWISAALQKAINHPQANDNQTQALKSEDNGGDHPIRRRNQKSKLPANGRAESSNDLKCTEDDDDDEFELINGTTSSSSSTRSSDENLSHTGNGIAAHQHSSLRVHMVHHVSQHLLKLAFIHIFHLSLFFLFFYYPLYGFPSFVFA